MKKADIAIIGAGIAGLAHAYHCLRQGLRVVLFEREAFSVGASVRNFGMIWPVGQPKGEDFRLAMRSRHHWKELAHHAGFPIRNGGSLHLAYHEDEWAVLNEFVNNHADTAAEIELVSPEKAVSLSPVVKRKGLVGAMHSTTESTVYSREAVRALLAWLEKDPRMTVVRKTVVSEITLPLVKAWPSNWLVEHVIVCSGADMETLYPGVFAELPLAKCKLQMMRLTPNTRVDIGPSLCAGLTLRHYKSFAACSSLAQVDARYDAEDPRLKKYGIHVLVSQTPMGDLIVGDSHEYGSTLEPFDSDEIDRLILEHFERFVDTGGYRVAERWNGTYAKLQKGTYVHVEAEPKVHIVNGFGGAGMTLSLGVAEQVVDDLLGVSSKQVDDQHRNR